MSIERNVVEQTIQIFAVDLGNFGERDRELLYNAHYLLGNP